MPFKLPFNLKYTYHFLVPRSFLVEVSDSKFGSSKRREKEKKKDFSSLPLLDAVAEKNFPDFFLLLILKVSIAIFDNYWKSESPALF